MAGALIKIDEEIVTSAVASVTLLGIDSTYDVYMVQVKNVRGSTNTELNARVTIGGTAQSGASDYAWAVKLLKSGGSFQNISTSSDSRMFSTGYFQNSATNTTNGTLYLFNFSSISEYAFITTEGTGYFSGSSIEANGNQGGGVYKQTGTARDGINFYEPNGNIQSGKFTLFGLKK
jgi:hypothetical protein